ncbi:ankyrin repeat protein [Histoplasma capsulatum G186AR]|uniref:Ankyrin repeat protein n=1 Tax=Ajellomyces capsulatus (strain G186AR / H82 / ATCC MYA-2454 / RMSCC 2432) TaxID=447093 RepID=C0NY82_AJECG|nr:ankyrin repeat protein [Histoplasma capsulatum G186AR]EEH03750.1 ankyrin repeat protein [Histoplasma capsulatum G186AR]
MVPILDSLPTDGRTTNCHETGKFGASGTDVTALAATASGRTAIEGEADHGRLDVLCMLLQIYLPGQAKNDQLKRAEKLAEKNEHTGIIRVIRNYQNCEG